MGDVPYWLFGRAACYAICGIQVTKLHQLAKLNIGVERTYFTLKSVRVCYFALNIHLCSVNFTNEINFRSIFEHIVLFKYTNKI